MKFGIRESSSSCVMLGLLAAATSSSSPRANAKRADAAGGDRRRSSKALTDLQQATAGIDDLNRKIDELQKAIKFFESKLPQEKEIDKILKEVWQMAEANSLQTKTIKTLQERARRRATASSRSR